MKLLVKIFSLCFFVSTIISCEKEKKELNKKFNTTITINYKNIKSEEFIIFQSMDTLPLNNYSIIKPPIHNTVKEKNKITFEFYIQKPRILMIGFNKFIVQPNDKFIIDYDVIKQDKYTFEEKINIISGSGVLLAQNGQEIIPWDSNFVDIYFNSSDKLQLDKFLNVSFFKKEADKKIKLTNLSHVAKNKIEIVKNTLQNYYLNYHLSGIIYQSKTKKTNFNTSLQNYANNKIGYLIAEFNNNELYELNKNWNLLKLYFDEIFSQFSKNNNYSKKIISESLVKFDYKTEQFFYLKIAENILKEPHYDKNNFKEIINSITYPPFKKEAAKFIVKNETGNFIDDNLKNISFFDTNLKPITFEKIFQTTTQKYLYFDFCGSWCMPCVKEIKEYSKTKKFDNSKNVRPIWIFFEKDKKAWFKVIEKYNLKKENCFLIDKKDVNDFNKNFGRNYNWRGEFPHHSLFNKKGSIKDENPQSLEKLEEKDFR